MNRPYIICHVVTSIDGKITGEFLSRPECEAATDVYYELNREYNKTEANGYFQRTGVIDELSLVVAPVIADVVGRPRFMNSTVSDFELKEIKQYGNVVWMNYVRK